MDVEGRMMLLEMSPAAAVEWSVVLTVMGAILAGWVVEVAGAARTRACCVVCARDLLLV